MVVKSFVVLLFVSCFAMNDPNKHTCRLDVKCHWNTDLYLLPGGWQCGQRLMRWCPVGIVGAAPRCDRPTVLSALLWTAVSVGSAESPTLPTPWASSPIDWRAFLAEGPAFVSAGTAFPTPDPVLTAESGFLTECAAFLIASKTFIIRGPAFPTTGPPLIGGPLDCAWSSNLCWLDLLYFFTQIGRRAKSHSHPIPKPPPVKQYVKPRQ